MRTLAHMPLMVVGLLIAGLMVIMLVLSRPEPPRPGLQPTLAAAESVGPTARPRTPAPSTARITTPAPVPEADLEPALEPPTSGCRQQFGIGDAQSLGDTAYYAQTVFVGHLTSVGEAGWSSAGAGSTTPGDGMHAPPYIPNTTQIRGRCPYPRSRCGGDH